MAVLALPMTLMTANAMVRRRCRVASERESRKSMPKKMRSTANTESRMPRSSGLSSRMVETLAAAARPVLVAPCAFSGSSTRPQG